MVEHYFCCPSALILMWLTANWPISINLIAVTKICWVVQWLLLLLLNFYIWSNTFHTCMSVMSCKWSKMIWKFKVCCKNLWIMTIYQVSGPQTYCIYHKIYVRWLSTKSLLPAHAIFTTKFLDDDYFSSLWSPNMQHLP